jgi:outer membrane protein TolC
MAIRIAIVLASVTWFATTAVAAPVGKEAPAPTSDKLRQLQKERVATLKEQLQGLYERVKIGKEPLIDFIEAIRELADAEFDLAETREQRLTAVEGMVNRLREGEQETEQLQRAGLQTKQGVAQIKAARLKAEIQLEKLKLAK